MKVAVGADHAGFSLKGEIVAALREAGRDVIDVGAFSDEPSDYPDFAEAVGKAIAEGRAERGILMCGSGVGVSVAANKIPGIRASVCHDTYSAHQGVEHDDMNVLVLGTRVVGRALARELVLAFLAARFSGEERHERRLAKIRALEARFRAP
jgi:ribose 5-phosphate isomerase B